VSSIGPIGSGASAVDVVVTGTGDGRLFAFRLKQNTMGSIVAEVDRTNAKVIAADDLKLGNQSNAFAFAFWGGDFRDYRHRSRLTAVERRHRRYEDAREMSEQLPVLREPAAPPKGERQHPLPQRQPR
jgi:hypothetical protein